MGHFSAAIEKCIFLFNLILLGIAIFLIYWGISDQALPKEISKIAEFANQLSIASKIIIGVGVILFVVSFFGCWGAFVESTSFLSLYALFLVILIAVEAFVGFYVYFKQDSATDIAKKALENGMQKYHSDKTYQESFDYMQSNWRCCGENGPKDWENIEPRTVPKSCCKDNTGTQECKSDGAYEDGCFSKLIDNVKQYETKIKWIVVGIVAFKILVVLLTLVVRSSILESRRMII